MWRHGGQLLQATGTISVKALRQECARYEGKVQGGQSGWNRGSERDWNSSRCAQKSNRSQIL